MYIKPGQTETHYMVEYVGSAKTSITTMDYQGREFLFVNGKCMVSTIGQANAKITRSIKLCERYMNRGYTAEKGYKIPTRDDFKICPVEVSARWM